MTVILLPSYAIKGRNGPKVADYVQGESIMSKNKSNEINVGTKEAIQEAIGLLIILDLHLDDSWLRSECNRVKAKLNLYISSLE